MRLSALTLFLLAGCNAYAPEAQWPASPCRIETYEGNRFTVCDPGSGKLRLFAASRSEIPLRSFAEIMGKVPANQVAFAMNAGMFDEAGRPIGLAVVWGILAAVLGNIGESDATDGAGFSAFVLAIFLAFYLGIPLLTLHWYAKFYRKAAETMSLGELEFGFDATTWQWLKLFLGNIALAVVTLGFGLAYWGYRNWAFMVRHMHLYGEINVTALGQSTTRAPTEAEGFADAFDMGAI